MIRLAEMRKKTLSQHIYFLLFALAFVLALGTPLSKLLRLASTHDYDSHILFIVPISAYLICRNRQDVFSNVRADIRTTLGLLPVAGISWFVAQRYSFDGNAFSLEIAAIVLLWISGFILCYGVDAFRRARFALLFLFLMIPIPGFLLDTITFLLQSGSAAVAYAFFKIAHVPVFKDGFRFLLPNLSIEVAEQCSGIRSSLALLITTLLLGEFLLRSNWKKSWLVLSVLPIVILKNALRIVTISLLTIYVHRGFLHGWLHTSGGIVFYLLGLLALIPVVIMFKRGESASVVSAVNNESRSGTNSEHNVFDDA